MNTNTMDTNPVYTVLSLLHMLQFVTCTLALWIDTVLPSLLRLYCYHNPSPPYQTPILLSFYNQPLYTYTSY